MVVMGKAVEVVGACFSVVPQYLFQEICWHSFHNLSSRLISKNFKIKIHKTIPVVLYGCGTWSLILKEEERLRVFENWGLRIYGPKREGGEDCIMRSVSECY
jgi:hypothetical protein